MYCEHIHLKFLQFVFKLLSFVFNQVLLSHHFMANRWGNSGNSVRLYFWGSKITADGDFSHEINRCLLLGRKTVTNLNSISKSRDIT